MSNFRAVFNNYALSDVNFSSDDGMLCVVDTSLQTATLDSNFTFLSGAFGLSNIISLDEIQQLSSGITFLGSLLPKTLSTYDIGSSAFKWRKGYFGTIQLSSGAVSNYVLTSDVSGNGNWTSLSSLGVSSLTGTANQVLVNGTSGTPTVGDITLTTPQSIATTSNVEFNQVTTPTLVSNSSELVIGTLFDPNYISLTTGVLEVGNGTMGTNKIVMNSSTVGISSWECSDTRSAIHRGVMSYDHNLDRWAWKTVNSTTRMTLDTTFKSLVDLTPNSSGLVSLGTASLPWNNVYGTLANFTSSGTFGSLISPTLTSASSTLALTNNDNGGGRLFLYSDITAKNRCELGVSTSNEAIYNAKTTASGLAGLYTQKSGSSFGANGRIVYNHSSDLWTIAANNTDVLSISSTKVYPTTDSAISLGDATHRFTQFYTCNGGLGSVYTNNTSASGEIVVESNGSTGISRLTLKDSGATTSFTITEWSIYDYCEMACGTQYLYMGAGQFLLRPTTGVVTIGDANTSTSSSLRLGNTSQTANNTLTFNNTSSYGSYIQFLSAGSTKGQIDYQNSTDTMNFYTAGTNRVKLTTTTLEPITTNAISLGTTSARYATAYLDKVTNKTSSMSASACVDLTGTTTTGFLCPVLTTTQRDAVASPATGLWIYNSTTNTPHYYNGTAWKDVQPTVALAPNWNYNGGLTTAYQNLTFAFGGVGYRYYSPVAGVISGFTITVGKTAFTNTITIQLMKNGSAVLSGAISTGAWSIGATDSVYSTAVSSTSFAAGDTIGWQAKSAGVESFTCTLIMY